MNKFVLIVILFLIKSAHSESYVKAGDSLIWDSENKSYTANGDVEFQNDKFIAFADEMIAQYVEKNNKETFTVVELFTNVRIEFKDEIFKGNYAIYTRKDNIIRLTGNVSIQSPTRLLTGYELIADIDNNKRILNSANDESLVEVLLDNNANN
tara:strand:- start:1436 stop:1894 length:459 start_codon:yes stop_codon:yes gene_type:complete